MKTFTPNSERFGVIPHVPNTTPHPDAQPVQVKDVSKRLPRQYGQRAPRTEHAETLPDNNFLSPQAKRAVVALALTFGSCAVIGHFANLW